jgi:hypothetical protein
MTRASIAALQANTARVVAALRELDALGVAYPSSADVGAQVGWATAFTRRALTMARRAGAVTRNDARCGWRVRPVRPSAPPRP